MNKLIKNNDKFILVSDEEIKEGDLCYDIALKIFQASHNYNGYNTDLCKKIISENPDFSLLSEEELSNITTANVEVILKNNVCTITKIIKK